MDTTGYPTCLGCGRPLMFEADAFACSVCGSTERRHTYTKTMPRITRVATPHHVKETPEP